MNGQINNPHRLDPLTRACLGCGLPATSCKTTKPECAAFYRDLAGLTIVITTAEKLILLVAGTQGVRLDQSEMFAVRDAIDEGVRDLRAGARSTAGQN